MLPIVTKRNRVAVRTIPSRRTRKRRNIKLTRRFGYWATQRINGLPYRPPNYLREACIILNKYIRLVEKDRKRHPELYPTPQQILREIEQRQFMREVDEAMDRVYGPDRKQGANGLACPIANPDLGIAPCNSFLASWR